MQIDFNISFSNLYTRHGLIELDKIFLNYVQVYNNQLFHLLVEIRQCIHFQSHPISKIKNYSNVILELAYLLDAFIAKLFKIDMQIEQLTKNHKDFVSIYQCKRLFIHRYALKKYTNIININFDDVVTRLSHFFIIPITDMTFAHQVMSWLQNKEHHKAELDLAAQYAAWRVKYQQSILFSTKKILNHKNLISYDKKQIDDIDIIYSSRPTRRQGFNLTSQKPSLDEILENTHYCIHCHKQNKDSCSHGFFDQNRIFKKSILDVELHGCPLEQKISEMNLAKSLGYSIASLAIVMIDNPLCAATGYRICNDCMNSCIYQRQEPVNVPMIETRVLDDVLNLPYGFEIYSLLSRWNPLNFQRTIPKSDTGKNVLIVGLGPSGFNLAHHLLNDGHNVVAIDGLKIEPLIDTKQLIKDFHYEQLSTRIADGFGGVSEYGITSRWDKNYLKIIRLLLTRRTNFAMYGGIRFGSSITVTDSFNLGFDHIALALGSGRPKIIKIKNILARGVRMASDFLMSLQLIGAMKFDSIVNLQIRIPIVVIGGGLTAIDTATEALAYYPVQVRKFLMRYNLLVSKYGIDYVERDWTEEEHIIANEFISHANLIHLEQETANNEGREIKILELIQSLGGVKVIYRKELQDSPSYRVNSAELNHALLEGIYFIENLEPLEIITDKYNHAKLLKLKDTKSQTIKYIKARSILIAVGTEPNTVIANEDKQHFKVNNGYFIHLDSLGNEIAPNFSPKTEHQDRILVYKQENKAISFFGDLHPGYHGSVVKAMASAKNGYPIITQLLMHKLYQKEDLQSQITQDIICPNIISRMNKAFFHRIKKQFISQIITVKYLTDKIMEIVIRAPLATKNFQPGQFFRLQNFASYMTKRYNTTLTMEGVAVTGISSDRDKGTISTIVLDTGGSTNICKLFQVGEQVILMGPAGTPTDIH
ncbi:FAD-dependent oxidoreductase [Wolbachia endosymbiont of Howardula sp.]|uniref:FAD-dependent oxidoreductase n=1 Tax=Wolbachia endosymbiont of Howardula sp. TaxID=2916816 RepID=UPI00217D730B|nr:FAD-dependent oxidoreductase [Wolbachia endosymbiont of Howardula sp.]UWI83250.1 FAD-dependent oxidoreductase [Wolbachia endosymbiont of Howardula sp.]